MWGYKSSMTNWIDIKDDPIEDLIKMSDAIRSTKLLSSQLTYISKELADKLIELGYIKSDQITIVDLLGDANEH